MALPTVLTTRAVSTKSVTVYERGCWLELKVVYSAVVSEKTAKGLEYGFVAVRVEP